MTSFILPISTFIFTLSVVVLLKFLVSMGVSTYSNPPKPYEFTKNEPILYMVLLSYIITYLIYI
jgi:hypothetical protein